MSFTSCVCVCVCVCGYRCCSCESISDSIEKEVVKVSQCRKNHLKALQQIQTEVRWRKRAREGGWEMELGRGGFKEDRRVIRGQLCACSSSDRRHPQANPGQPYFHPTHGVHRGAGGGGGQGRVKLWGRAAQTALP